MAISGGTALYIGFLPVEWDILIAVVAIIWGASVVADSAQFSTALTELSDDDYRGTALAFQTGIGFLLTIAPIRFLPVMADSVGWGPAFAVQPLARPWGSPPCYGCGPCRKRWPWLWDAANPRMTGGREPGDSVFLLGDLETESYRAGDGPVKVPFRAVLLRGDP
jgi:hypothetical protein